MKYECISVFSADGRDGKIIFAKTVNKPTTGADISHMVVHQFEKILYASTTLFSSFVTFVSLIITENWSSYQHSEIYTWFGVERKPSWKEQQQQENISNIIFIVSAWIVTFKGTIFVLFKEHGNFGSTWAYNSVWHST